VIRRFVRATKHGATHRNDMTREKKEVYETLTGVSGAKRRECAPSSELRHELAAKVAQVIPFGAEKHTEADGIPRTEPGRRHEQSQSNRSPVT